MKKTATLYKAPVIAFVLSAMFGWCTTGAQTQSSSVSFCGSDRMQQQLFLQHPGLQQQAAQNNQRIQDEGKRNLQDNRSATPPTYIIPVVFHIVHNYGTENISDAQVLDAVNHLNVDYRKLNPDTSLIVAPFDTLFADAEIEFRLAQLDPNGNCTNGIDRIASPETNVGDDGSKLNQWPRDKYLNIWVVRQIAVGSIAAFTYSPAITDPAQMAPYDGVLVLHDFVGTIGTSSPTTGHTLTHEVGHWLNLNHPWGSGPAGVACGDDGIADTPITKGSTFCQLTNPTPCNAGISENVQNFMETSYCLFMFTPDQRDAMHMTLNSSVSQRNNIWTNANLVATGVMNTSVTCLPHADFKSNRKMICEGGSVTFTDQSWGNSATAWQWTLSGPATLTSSSQNPVFSNLTATGWYHVTLVATNSAGADTITKISYLLVSSDTAAFSPLYSEGFEMPNTFQLLGYIPVDGYGNVTYFTQVLFIGNTGSGSAVLNTKDNCLKGDVDELITPSYFLSYNTGLQLSFAYAYATADSTTGMNTQSLKLFSSVDCGQTWTVRWQRSGAAMQSAGYEPALFIPTGFWDWDTATVNLPGSCAAPNVRFKFEFTSPEDGVGNYLYIDDINILATNVGIAETDNTNSFTVYPNPGDGNSTMAYTLSEQASVQYSIYDLSGRLVSSVDQGKQSAGSYSVPLSDEAAPLAPGTYFIEMKIGETITIQKYVVAE